LALGATRTLLAIALIPDGNSLAGRLDPGAAPHRGVRVVSFRLALVRELGI
jgi:hypothetical protein